MLSKLEIVHRSPENLITSAWRKPMVPVTTTQITDDYSRRLLTLPRPQQSFATAPLGEDASTVLEQVIADIPWQSSFILGAGVNAITGGVSGNALKPFEPNGKPGQTSVESYRFIQSDNEMNREIEVSASGMYNIQGVDVSASASYLGTIKYSDVSTTLIAEYQSQDNEYAEADVYELTDEAKSHLADPTEFRKHYGDYFISGVRRGARFFAVYTCTASSIERMDSFKATIAATTPEVFSVDGKTKFEQAVRDYAISLSVNVFMEGKQPDDANTPGGPWTTDKVLEALDWFKKHQQGKPLEAKLRHYSTLAFQYPQSINVAPDVFVALRQLYTKLWEIRSRYAACPSLYQKQLTDEYNAFDAGVVANQDVLATDAAKLLDYQQKADDLLPKLQAVNDRMEFYSKLKNLVSTEPGNGQEMSVGSGQPTWLYGYSAYPKSAAVVIQSTELSYKAKPHVGRRENTLDFGPNAEFLIVGWQVISHWENNSNGSWWKATNQILLTDYAAVHVRSKYDRGCNWSLVIYYVDAKDYQFGDEA